MSFRVREILRLQEQPIWLHEVCYGHIEPPRRPHGGLVPPTDLIRPCFIEPFDEGSSRTPRDLTPIVKLLDVIMRRTLLLRMGYREGLTHIQLWLLNTLMQQIVFDVWDVILSEMEDTLAKGFRGHRQLSYAHWITFLIHRAVTVRPSKMLAQYSGATIEFSSIQHDTDAPP